ncbi:MAG: chromate efflux transporter, partial [Bdellovibrionota bacterium]
AFRFWLKLGFVSFGGPTGQIALMHRELVDKKHWVDEPHFLHALNYCMLLPGPEAQQLATYVGWLLHGTKGGLAAGILFIFPSIFILWTLSYVYAAYGAIPWIAAVFYGLKPAVLGLVAAAVLRIGQKALKNGIMWGVAAAAFVLIFFLRAPFPLIVLGAGLLGFVGGKYWQEKFLVIKGHGPDGTLIRDGLEKPSWGRSAKIIAVCLALWAAPVVLLALASDGWRGTFAKVGLFFSKAAMVTFGGAYAVLPYVAQQAVEKHHWLSAPQMLDGLGLAETTPGPLIMVVEFVGFMAGWNHPPAGFPLTVSATIGALLAVWTTFVPCFLWIFLGAPYIERLRGVALLSSSLSAITAAVVGVVLNLAVWFGLHVLFPEAGGFDWFVAVVAAVSFVLLHRFKWEAVPVVLGSGLLGLIYKFAVS